MNNYTPSGAGTGTDNNAMFGPCLAGERAMITPLLARAPQAVRTKLLCLAHYMPWELFTRVCKRFAYPLCGWYHTLSAFTFHQYLST